MLGHVMTGHLVTGHLVMGHVVLLLALLVEVGVDQGTAFRLTETHMCNMTSAGSAFSGGYYGSRLLKPVPVPPTHAETDFVCWYSFRGVTGQRLVFQLRQLSVGHFDTTQQRCERGYVRLWDGLHRPGFYTYPPNTVCGHYPDGSILLHKYTSGGNAEVEYLTTLDHPQHQPGFTLTYKYINVDIEADMFPLLSVNGMKRASSAVCDWLVQTEACPNSLCDLVSPGHPGIYPPHVECQYHVFSSDTTSALQISFKDFFTGKGRFNIISSPACEHEQLAVYNGDSPESPLIGRFCGQDMPDITTSGNHLFLQFFTGPSLPPFNNDGFHATVMAVTKEWNLSGHVVSGTLCDWLFNRSEGSVSAPDHWLPPQTTCTYTLHVKPGFYTETLLAVYGLSPGCEDSITLSEDGRVIDEICERALGGRQARFQYHLVGQNVTITYFTGRGQHQAQPDRGFWLSFRQVKGARKFPVIIQLKDEAARYTVDQPLTGGSTTALIGVRTVCVLLLVSLSLGASIRLHALGYVPLAPSGVMTKCGQLKMTVGETVLQFCNCTISISHRGMCSQSLRDRSSQVLSAVWSSQALV